MSYTDYGDDRYNAKRVERVLGECEAAWRGMGALGMPDLNTVDDAMHTGKMNEVQLQRRDQNAFTTTKGAE